MKTSYRVWICSLTVLTFALSSAPLLAQDDPFASCDIITSCAGTNVDLDFSINVYAEVPEPWVGFVLIRWTNGVCDSEVILTDVMPFPEGEASYTFQDTPEAGHGVFYNLHAIDAEGNLQNYWIPYPRRQYFTHSRCPGGHDAFGRVTVDAQGFLGLEQCMDPCWHYIGIESSYPEEMADYVGQFVFVYGDIVSGWCFGDFIRAESFTPVPMNCNMVATGTESWGSLKQMYR